MNKAFEKILEMLEETDFNDIQMTVREVLLKYGFPYESVVQDEVWDALDELSTNKFAKRIVHEVAEEYKDGWIPCSERLPSDFAIHEVTAQFSNGRTYTEFGYYDEEMKEWWKFDDDVLLNVVAWKEQSEPYKEND